MIDGIMPDLKILYVWVKGQLSDFNLTCMKRAKEVYPESDFIFYSDRLAPFLWMHRIAATYLGINSPQIYSDYARLFYLSENLHTLYIDCDVYCLKPIPTDKFGSAGIWAIYNHDKLSVINNILRNRKGQKMNVYYGKDLALAGRGINKYFIHREPKITKHLKERE